MSAPVLTLYELCFAVIGLLPVLFFRGDGRFHLMWWVTALPFFLCPVVLALGYAGVLHRVGPPGWRPALEAIAVVPAVASLALLFATLGTHRTPLALWHQEDDAPRAIVTYGTYRRIRHPFYASFLLAFCGAALAFPHWLTLAPLAYAAVVLNGTAAREERRLSGSAFGVEYRDYARRTGRFVPGI